MSQYKIKALTTMLVIGTLAVGHPGSSFATDVSDSTPDPWGGSPQGIADLLRAEHQTLDYARILGDGQVLFLGENHSNGPVRDHIVDKADHFRSVGITHYLIEANEKGNNILERLNRGEAVDLSNVDLGPGGEDYERAVRAMAKRGIEVVAFDIDQSTKPTKEEREARMHENLLEVFRRSPKAKVAVLVGGFHTDKKNQNSGVDTMAMRAEATGLRTIAVRLAGGTESTPRMLTEAAKQAGLSTQDFSLDLRPHAKSKYVVYGGGSADHVVHLRQRPSIGGTGHRFGLELGLGGFGRSRVW